MGTSKARRVLLLTATITPREGDLSLARTDPKQRLADYLTALRYYLKPEIQTLFDLIVFAENSNSDLVPLREQAAAAGGNAKVEVVGLYGLDYPVQFSRGYGEFLLADRAMDHLERSLKPEDIIWKVTGRYILRNIASLVSSRPDCDLYCNCRKYPRPWTDQHVMSWKFGAYQGHLKGIYRHFIHQVPSSEEVLYQLISSGHFDAIRVAPRFRRTAVLEGIRGWDNQPYNFGWKTRAKLLTRQVASYVAPRLWI